MKIALVNEWLDPGRGGAETAVGQYVRHLLDANIEVTIVTRSDVEFPGASIALVKGAGGSRSRSSVLFPVEAAKVAQQTGSDLIHSICPIPNADIYQPRGGTVAETLKQNVALRRSKPAKLLKRVLLRLSPKQRQLLKIEQNLLNRDPAPMVVALSDYVIDQLQRHYLYPDELIRKVFNAVDPDPADDDKKRINRQWIRKQLSIDEDRCVALLVAHNFKLKGVPFWLEAAKRIRQEHGNLIHTIIVGKGESPRWHNRINQMGLEGHVTLIGAVPKIREYYHAADFLVHPSWYDPCSRVVLEAVSSGLPCITSIYDGSSEIIRHGENGYILTLPDDPSLIAEYAAKLALMDPQQRKAMGGGIDPNEISMKRHADEMIRVYEETLSRKIH